MGKELTFKMSKKIVGMAEKPLRTREEAVLLLLYTIRMFDAERFFEDRRNEEVKISINKMNRIFYLLMKRRKRWFVESWGNRDPKS